MNLEERKAIEVVRDELFTAETRIFDQVSATFRWVMATLFAANGGAIIALFGRDLDRPLRLCALGWFALGVVFSILMGAASSLMAGLAMTRMTKARLQMVEGLILGTVPKEALDSFLERQKITWKTWTPSYLGVASFLCFVGGLVTVGIVLSQAG